MIDGVMVSGDSAPDATGRPIPLCAGEAVDGFVSDPHLCVTTYAVDLARPRVMAVAPNGDVFVETNGTITVLFDDDGDGVSGPDERSTWGRYSGLNHGLAIDPSATFVYASSETTVVRWPYRSGQRTAMGAAQVVVRNIPRSAHVTRPLMIDRDGLLYVVHGSDGNIDFSPDHSLIRRFRVSAESTAVEFAAGELFANGLRNEVALTQTRDGSIWGVENGRDNLTDMRFGGDIHMDNPGEEMHRFGAPGRFFGYPFCWSEGTLAQPQGGSGTQHADLSPQIPPDQQKTEAWCQDTTNVARPVAALPAHWAPLGMAEIGPGVFPAEWLGNLLVTSHGSWNREIRQQGRLIARVQVRADGSTTAPEVIVSAANAAGQSVQGYWAVRPVDIRSDRDGSLLVTDDAQGQILRIGYRP
jgi:glucose/arabinose dehydrogenase